MRFISSSPALLLLLLPASAGAIEGPFTGTYAAQDLEFANLAGRVEVEVGGSEISVDISGDDEELRSVSVSESRGTLMIVSSKSRRRMSGSAADYALYRISVPAGTSVTISGLIGEAEIGDINADLDIDASSLEAVIGDVRDASLSVGGAGDIRIGEVQGDLMIEIAGAGSIGTGDARSAEIMIGGSGDVTTGALAGGLDASIAGSGELDVESVNGPVSIEVAGSGDIFIGGGRANPFTVEVLGSGDVVMEGEAVDPDISVFGSGSVTLGSYTGKLRKQGQPNITIKSQ